MEYPDLPQNLDDADASTHKSGLKISMLGQGRVIFKSARAMIDKFVPSFAGPMPIDDNDLVEQAHAIVFLDSMKPYASADMKLTWKWRLARGYWIWNRSEEAMKLAVDESDVDQILESALQQGDFKAIRTILNFEGYGIPLDEPNDLVLPAECNNGDLRDAEDIEIYISPEAYEISQMPLEMCDPEPVVQNSAFHQAFVEVMANNTPLRLERFIRQKDIGMLRMWLKLYGHNILPKQPTDQNDVIDEPTSRGNLRPNAPDPSSNT